MSAPETSNGEKLTEEWFLCPNSDCNFVVKNATRVIHLSKTHHEFTLIHGTKIVETGERV